MMDFLHPIRFFVISPIRTSPVHRLPFLVGIIRLYAPLRLNKMKILKVSHSGRGGTPLRDGEGIYEHYPLSPPCDGALPKGEPSKDIKLSSIFYIVLCRFRADGISPSARFLSQKVQVVQHYHKMEVKIVKSLYMEIFVKYLQLFPIYGKISVLKII